jgi:hypothetical protein
MIKHYVAVFHSPHPNDKGHTMMSIHSKKRSAALAVIAALAFAASGSTAFAATMTKPEYSAAKNRISSEYKVDKKACSSSSGNQKDICVEQAKAKEKVARAELEFGYTGKASDGTKVATVKADTSYAVAKEMCDDKAGNAKDVCREEAKAAHTKALADSKMATKVSEAKVEAADAKMDADKTKRDADYKVAAEKCETLAGDAKTACVNAAKARFNKT